MSGFRIVTTTQILCAQCGAELRGVEDWSRHRSMHTIEYHASTPDGRRLLAWCQDLIDEQAKSRNSL